MVVGGFYFRFNLLAPPTSRPAGKLGLENTRVETESVSQTPVSSTTTERCRRRRGGYGADRVMIHIEATMLSYQRTIRAHLAARQQCEHSETDIARWFSGQDGHQVTVIFDFFQKLNRKIPGLFEVNGTMMGDDEVANQTISSSSNETVVGDVLNGTTVPSTWIEWDDWDQSLWSPEQRLLLEQGAIPREVHISLGVLLTLIVLFGIIANSTILYVFSR